MKFIHIMKLILYLLTNSEEQNYSVMMELQCNIHLYSSCFLWYILYILVCCSHATLNIYLFNLQQSSLSSCITALQRLTAVTMLKLTLRKMTLTFFDCKRITAVFLGPIESQISWNQRKDTATAFTVVYLGVLNGFCSYCIFFHPKKQDWIGKFCHKIEQLSKGCNPKVVIVCLVFFWGVE